MAKKDELNFEADNKKGSSEKLKALQAAMEKIEKNFGKGSIMKMGDESVEQVEVIPTGSIGLNVALGVGGYPRGRIIEIYGPESSGKRHSPFMPSPKRKKPEGSLLSSMRSTRSTAFTQPNSAWISTIYGYLNPTTENKRWKLPSS